MHDTMADAARTTVADEAGARRRLAELERRFPLPEGCAQEEPLFQTTAVDDLELSMVGLVARAPGATAITGAAAGLGEAPVERAFFELALRLCVHAARVRPPTQVFPVRDRDGVLARGRGRDK